MAYCIYKRSEDEDEDEDKKELGLKLSKENGTSNMIAQMFLLYI